MPIHKRLGIDTPREYTGEEDCRELLEWLNKPVNDAEHKRVRSLLDNILHLLSGWELKDKLSTKPSTAIVGPFIKNFPHREDQVLEYVRDDFEVIISREIDSVCRRYIYFPQFFPMGQYLKGLGPVWWSVASNSRKYALGWAKKYDEMRAVFDLNQLAKDGLLTRIKKCVCGRWLFARFEHQRFCNASCREKAYRSSPAEKKKRREWARRYYWIQKHRNVK
jgi:hypothetical protein